MSNAAPSSSTASNAKKPSVKVTKEAVVERGAARDTDERRTTAGKENSAGPPSTEDQVTSVRLVRRNQSERERRKSRLQASRQDRSSIA
ncbi:hypothetical protein C8034_v005627 [Colletotrichum sidae]|uniref:Uncharacterized protein n=1 Tax=Colletotrichum sidae TaxID=1347389 RepID=A0A4R8T602_9PEZI|nr:hypothetical protein C8034_v005627 [Colletotrichum sidae]